MVDLTAGIPKSNFLSSQPATTPKSTTAYPSFADTVGIPNSVILNSQTGNTASNYVAAAPNYNQGNVNNNQGGGYQISAQPSGTYPSGSNVPNAVLTTQIGQGVTQISAQQAAGLNTKSTYYSSGANPANLNQLRQYGEYNQASPSIMERGTNPYYNYPNKPIANVAGQRNTFIAGTDVPNVPKKKPNVLDTVSGALGYTNVGFLGERLARGSAPTDPETGLPLINPKTGEAYAISQLSAGQQLKTGASVGLGLIPAVVEPVIAVNAATKAAAVAEAKQYLRNPSLDTLAKLRESGGKFTVYQDALFTKSPKAFTFDVPTKFVEAKIQQKLGLIPETAIKYEGASVVEQRAINTVLNDRVDKFSELSITKVKYQSPAGKVKTAYLAEARGAIDGSGKSLVYVVSSSGKIKRVAEISSKAVEGGTEGTATLFRQARKSELKSTILPNGMKVSETNRLVPLKAAKFKTSTITQTAETEQNIFKRFFSRTRAADAGKPKYAKLSYADAAQRPAPLALKERKTGSILESLSLQIQKLKRTDTGTKGVGMFKGSGTKGVGMFKGSGTISQGGVRTKLLKDLPKYDEGDMLKDISKNLNSPAQTQSLIQGTGESGGKLVTRNALARQTTSNAEVTALLNAPEQKPFSLSRALGSKTKIKTRAADSFNLGQVLNQQTYTKQDQRIENKYKTNQYQPSALKPMQKQKQDQDVIQFQPQPQKPEQPTPQRQEDPIFNPTRLESPPPNPTPTRTGFNITPPPPIFGRSPEISAGGNVGRIRQSFQTKTKSAYTASLGAAAFQKKAIPVSRSLFKKLQNREYTFGNRPLVTFKSGSNKQSSKQKPLKRKNLFGLNI